MCHARESRVSGAAGREVPHPGRSLLDCPVYLCFCLCEKRGNDHGYRIHLERFAERIDLPRRERLARLEAYLQQYARRLEHYCLQASDQWFNFYDFWHSAATDHSDKV